MERSPEIPSERTTPSCRRYAAERIVASVVVLWLEFTLLFWVFVVIPSDPAKQFAGKGATPETIAQARHYLGLDRSRATQYVTFLARIVRGDFGHSWYERESVNKIVREAVPVTLSLVFGGLLLAMIVGIPLGRAWGRRQRFAGPPAAALSYLWFALSPLWPWMFLLLALLDRLHVHPPSGGYHDFFDPPADMSGGPMPWASHLLLPWICIALAPAAVYVRAARRSAIEARAGDKAERRSFRVLMTKRLALDVAWLLGATVWIESTFGLPGVGDVTYVALTNYDLPTVQGMLVAVFVIQAGVTLVVDLVGAAVSKEWPRGYANLRAQPRAASG